MPKTAKLKMQLHGYNEHTYMSYSQSIIVNTVLAKTQTRHYAQTI